MEDSARGEVSEGTISDLLDKEGVRFFQFDAPVSPGGSGGPMVNSRGEVVAVTTLKVPELSGTLKYAIPAIYLKGLLAGKGDPPTLTPRPDEPKVPTTPPLTQCRYPLSYLSGCFKRVLTSMKKRGSKMQLNP